MPYPNSLITPLSRCTEFKSGLSILLWLLLCFSSTCIATTLTPFNVRYDVYRDDTKLGLADFSLNQENGIWHWNMRTKVTGFYSYLTKKRPFTHTQMQVLNGEQQLVIEQSGDYPDKPAKYTTWFDHSASTLYSLKDEQVNKTQFPDKLYNYHSIHLLYPHMLENELIEMSVNFYRKGNISTSILTLDQQVKSTSSDLIIDRVTQKFEHSDKLMIYEYLRDSFAPLRIEQIRPGKATTVMNRQP